MSRARIIVGDCRESMAALPAESVDAVVCDPPYHLTSIVDRFGKEGSAPVKVPEGGSGVYARSTKGFMGQTWDGGDVAFRVETWREVFRVLKPGGHLLAFSGSRTYHRMTCAIEDAGFAIRDQIMWVYGSGFPKSHNLDGEWKGWGTTLKPAHEPICLARKPLVGTVAANVLRHGTGAINVDGCRVGDDTERGDRYAGKGASPSGGTGAIHFGVRSEPWDVPAGRWPANFIHDGSDEATEGLRDAARFFYTAKASSEDRDEMLGDVPRNMHPTVKPTDLMRYLIRMVTPPGGTVLDPFTGSGSTGRAAMLEGMRFIGCELSPEYAEIARARIRFTLGPLFAHEVT